MRATWGRSVEPCELHAVRCVPTGGRSVTDWVVRFIQKFLYDPKRIWETRNLHFICAGVNREVRASRPGDLFRFRGDFRHAMLGGILGLKDALGKCSGRACGAWGVERMVVHVARGRVEGGGLRTSASALVCSETGAGLETEAASACGGE